jgi:hypothetical protein
MLNVECGKPVVEGSEWKGSTYGVSTVETQRKLQAAIICGVSTFQRPPAANLAPLYSISVSIPSHIPVLYIHHRASSSVPCDDDEGDSTRVLLVESQTLYLYERREGPPPATVHNSTSKYHFPTRHTLRTSSTS